MFFFWIFLLLLLLSSPVQPLLSQPPLYFTPDTSIIHIHIPEDKHLKTFHTGHSLVYVTPWSPRGYDYAKEYRGKFTYVSPIWFTVKRIQHSFDISGGHDVDRNWIHEVRGEQIERFGKPNFGRIVPRFSFQDWSRDDYVSFIADKMEHNALRRSILSEVKKYGFDGVVIEAAAQFALSEFLSGLAADLHALKKEIILVIPSKHGTIYVNFAKEHYDHFSQFIDKFSLMTYDYSQQGSGPNAPLSWMESEILRLCPTTENRAKLLLGFNFYGWDFGGKSVEPIVGPQYLSLLKKYQPEIIWDSEAKESYVNYTTDGSDVTKKSTGNGHQVWYPTLESIDARIHLAEDYDVGISIWELGQGLGQFLDLL